MDENLPIPAQGPTNIPLIFANGVVVGRTLTELQITLTMNGKAACLVVVPFPVGKTLSGAIENALEDHVKKSGQSIGDLKSLFDKEKESAK